MKHKHIIISLSLLLVASMAFAGLGRGRQMDNYGRGRQPANYGPRYNVAECILSDEERDQVQAARYDYEKSAIPMRSDIRVLRMEANQMIMDGKSQKDISAKLDKANALRAEMTEKKLDHQLAVRKIVGEDKYKQMGMATRAYTGRGNYAPAGNRQNRFQCDDYGYRRSGNSRPRNSGRRRY